MIQKEYHRQPVQPDIQDLKGVIGASLKAISLGPVSSFLGYIGYGLPLTRGLALKINPKLEDYFGEHEKPEIDVNLDQTSQVFSQIDQRLYNEGTSEHFISQELFLQWLQIKQHLTDQLNQHFALSENPGYLSNYVYFDRQNNQYTIFLIVEDMIYSFSISDYYDHDSEKFVPYFIVNNNHYSLDTFENFDPEFPTIAKLDQLPSISDADLTSQVAEELSISQLLTQIEDEDWSTQPIESCLRCVNSVTNEFPLVRHFDFEHEGWVIQELRNNGVHTIGELQDVLRMLFDQGICVENKTVVDIETARDILQDLDPDQDYSPMTSTQIFTAIKDVDLETLSSYGIIPEYQVIIDQDLASRAEQILLLACPEMDQDQAQLMLEKAVQDRAYYELILAQIKLNPQLVEDFMDSPVFVAHNQAFIDAHLAALGQTNRDIAEAMLAGYYLYIYERVDNPYDSNSQHYLADTINYHQDIQAFLDEYATGEIIQSEYSFANHKTGRIPALAISPEVTRDEIFAALIQDFYTMDEIDSLDLCLRSIDGEIKNKIIKKFDQNIDKARAQRLRHATHQVFLGKIQKTLHITVDPEQRKGVFPTLIANLAINHVKDPEGQPYLLSATWLPGNHGYLLRDGSKLPELEELVSMANQDLEQPEVSAHGQAREEQNQGIINRRLEQSIKYIFGIDHFTRMAGSDETEFDQLIAQEERIITETPVILEFLSQSQQVPENVREFIGEILSGNLTQKILETYGSISEQDPNIISMFYPKVAEFVLSVGFRYAFDFVRGIETNLLIQKGMISRLRAQVFDNWHPHDFSQVTSEALTQALDQTLDDGQHRLQILNHEVKDMENLKDVQEKLEIIFGWNTQDMKFLRWSQLWSVWNTLGGTWDCVCFSRKTVFNPRAFKAS